MKTIVFNGLDIITTDAYNPHKYCSHNCCIGTNNSLSNNNIIITSYATFDIKGAVHYSRHTRDVQRL